MLGTIILILLILWVIGAFPGTPWMSGRSYGYGPSGIGGVLLIIVIVLLLTGRL
jgi:Protein of unknown function (DUF3309)